MWVRVCVSVVKLKKIKVQNDMYICTHKHTMRPQLQLSMKSKKMFRAITFFFYSLLFAVSFFRYGVHSNELQK